MYSSQAYPGLCRAVLLAALLGSASAAQAGEGTANQVMLAPGKSITFSDAANPGVNVVVTAPADFFVNLSRLVAASEKGGIYSIMTDLQIKPAGDIVSNADGSLSLRPVSGDSYFVGKDATPAPGRVTLEGGTALLDRGQVVIHSARIVHTGVAMPGTPALGASPEIPTLPMGMAGQPVMPVSASVRTGGGNLPIQPTIQTTGPASLATFNTSGGATVLISPGGGPAALQVQGGNISLTGSLTSSTGNVVLSNTGGIVTTNQAPAISVGGLSITSSTPNLTMGGTVVQTGAKPPATPVVVPTR